MTAPVGSSVHRMGCVFHLPLYPTLRNIPLQSIFLAAGHWSFFFVPNFFLTLTSMAGVNQQPPMQQLRMRSLKPFWGWTKTHPSLPKVFGFSSLFSAPKFFPPKIPPSHLPLASYLPHLILICTHSIARAQEWLEREPQQRSRALETWPKQELEAGPRMRAWR